MDNERMIRFTMGGMAFEYDEQKNRINLQKHGISFKSAARVFFDYDRIEFLMMNTATMKTAMTPSETPPPEWSATRSGTL